MTPTGSIEDLLRELAPRVLAALLRRRGQFDRCEEAVQEALLAASRQWPDEGLPSNPGGWLLTVADRRLIDSLRSDRARRQREEAVGGLGNAGPELLQPTAVGTDHDDSLMLLVMCCHPALSRASQLALTLRAVGGLTTKEIAAAFFVPEPTMAQRISRAKATIAAAGARFELPPPAEVGARVLAVLQVLYLIFNEGHTATSGPNINRTDLAAEAIRLTRALVAARPDDHDAEGLLALMLLTDARRPARTDNGELVNLAEQDRSLWNQAQIAEGVALVTDALRAGAPGQYQLQAAIAAVHDEAPSDDETDWAQIVALYDLLLAVAPNPIGELSRAYALARRDGPQAGLEELAALAEDPRLVHHHRLHATRAHLLRASGRASEAREAFVTAARLATNHPEQRYLLTEASKT